MGSKVLDPDGQKTISNQRQEIHMEKSGKSVSYWENKWMAKLL